MCTDDGARAAYQARPRTGVRVAGIADLTHTANTLRILGPEIRPVDLCCPSRRATTACVRRRLLALLLLLLVPRPTHAHEPGLSRGEYRVTDRAVTSELVFARREILAQLLPTADADRDGQLGEFELLAVEADLRQQILAGMQVASGPAPCPGAITRVVFVEEDGLQIDARHDCPAGPLVAVTLRWPLLARLGPGHRHLGRLVYTGPEGHVPEDIPAIDFVAHARRSALTIKRPTPTAAPAPAPAPTVPTAPPPAPPVPAAPAPWPWLAAFAAALVALALARVLRRR